MIAEECRKLNEQLQEVAQAKIRKDIHDQLEARRIELAKIRDLVLAVTNSLEAIRNKTKLEGNLDSRKCLDRVRKIREALQDDPLSITKGRQFTDMKKAFEKFVTEGTVSAKETWEQFLPRTRPSVDKNQILQAEGLSRDDASKAAKLKSLDERSKNLAKKPPADAVFLAEIEGIWEDMRQIMAELPDVAEDPIVQEFLSAANTPEGASIDLLTDDVRAWLAEKKMTDKYRINTMS